MLESKPKMLKKGYEFLKKLHLRKKVSTDTWVGLLTILQKLQNQNQKTWFSRSAFMKRKIVFFKKMLFYPKFYSGQEDFICSTHAKTSRPKTFLSCAQRPKKVKKSVIFRKRGFSSSVSWTQTKLFWQLCFNLLLKTELFLLKCEFSRKIYKIFKKTVSAQMFLWTRRMQFWHSCC